MAWRITPGRGKQSQPTITMEIKGNAKSITIPTCGLVVFESRRDSGVSGQIKNDFSKFQLIIAGHSRLESEGKSHLSGPNTLLHIPAGHVYAQTDAPADPVTVCAIQYRPELLSPGLNSQLRALGALRLDLGGANINQARAVRSLFQEMLFEQDAGQEGWENILHSRLIDLAVRTTRLARRYGWNAGSTFEPGNDSTDRVARYTLRLKSQFFRQETISEAASSVGLSRRRFTELFRKVTGQSWRQYVMGLRLQHASNLLAESDRSVVTVAFESGFEDLSHFYHSFKAVHQCSPVVYREQRRVRLPTDLEIQSPSKNSPSTQPISNFKFRGIKGWFWKPEQYLEEIPGLAELKLNFLMNCYGSMIGSHPGKPASNEWWKPMTAEKKETWSEIIRACQKHDLTFCFALHPQLASPRPLDPTRDRDVEQFYRHYEWAQEQGTRWFSVCLDDTSWGSDGPAAGGLVHARLVNTIFRQLRASDSEAQFAFCPVICWGDATNREHRDYLDALAREMHPDVYVFWNGDSIVTPRITRVAAENYRKAVGHRLFLWDNYPVNDGSSTLHLGPVTGRSPELHEVVEGYLSNSMCDQNQINRLPLATCADYASNPTCYNPGRSIGQAILRQAKTGAQQQVLKDLVESYPGFIVAGGGNGTNPVREKFSHLVDTPNALTTTHSFFAQMEDIYSRLKKEFPDKFRATKITVGNDIDWMKHQLGGAN